MSEPVSSESLQPASVSRRQALKTGAFVAGSALWATPVIQAVTVAQASAEQPSGDNDNQDKNEKKEKKDK